MKKLVLLILSLCFYLQSFSQWSICDSLCNGIFTPNLAYNSTQNIFYTPFDYGYVNCWERYTITPQIFNNNDTNTTPPYAAFMWTNNIGNTESIRQTFNSLNPSKKYVFSLMAKRRNPNQNYNHHVYARALLTDQNNTVNVDKFNDVFNSPYQSILNLITPNNNNFVQGIECFYPQQNWNSLIVYPATYNRNNLYLMVDDVELYQITPELGPDTLICDTPTCIILGNHCNCNPLHLDNDYEWYELGNPTPFAYTDTVTVCPDQTTSYFLKHIMHDCPNCCDYDTIIVFIVPLPVVDLGPDTLICGEGCVDLYAENDPDKDTFFQYFWNTGDTTRMIRVCYSGTYSVVKMDLCGRSDTDSVTITIRPDIKINPKDTMLCEYNIRDINLSVNSGYSSYKWWHISDSIHILSDSNSLIANNAGYYIVSVSDSGCVRNDTAHIGILPTPHVDLGNDTMICGECLTLFGDTNNNMTNYWYSSDSSHSFPNGNIADTMIICNSGIYWLIAQSVEGCSDTDSIYVIIRPDFEIHPNDTTICALDTPVVIRVDSGYTSYSWYKSSDSGNVIGNDYQISVSEPGTYIVTVEDSACFRTDSAILQILYQPFIGFNGDTVYLCGPDSISWPLIKCKQKFIGNYKSGLNYRYRWSNSYDTITSYNKSTFVSYSGIYYFLEVWAGDCYDRDSIFIMMAPKRHMKPAGPFCANDNSVTIEMNSSYFKSLFFTGKGLTDNFKGVFDPSKAGPGEHIITCHYTDGYCCSGNDTIHVLVNPIPQVYIDPVPDVCISDDPFEIVYFNDCPYCSTRWSGSIDSISKIFDPAYWGIGSHTILLEVWDDIGCRSEDSITFSVHDTFSVFFNTSPEYNCIVPFQETSITINVNTSKSDSLFSFYWPQYDHIGNSFDVNWPGTFILITSNNGACIDTSEFVITDCCDMEPSFQGDLYIDSIEYPYNSPFQYLGEEIYVYDNIIVGPKAKMEIYNSRIFMNNCSKLIVEPTGHLLINESEIGFCNWKGIEVHGQYDACSHAYPGNVPAHQVVHGLLECTNSKITNADIGIFVGKRTPADTHDITYSGGVIKVENSEFRENYVDIMFSEWSFAGICECAEIVPPPWPYPDPDPVLYTFHSEIKYNTFYELADNENCSPFVDNTLERYNDFYGEPHYLCPSQFPSQRHLLFPDADPPPPYGELMRCHIIDLSPFTDLHPGTYFPCRKALWESCHPINPNCTSGNVFYNNCQNYIPHSHYE